MTVKNDQIITGKIIEKMTKYFGKDIGRINHALKVYGFANCIARRELSAENEILIIDIASILHDIGIKEAEKKYNSSSGKYQEIEGPPIAQKMLSETGLDKKTIDRICFLIGNHHSYHKIDGTDFQILVEADFLVNAYEDQMSFQSIESVRKKLFKTITGISIIESMYL